VSALGSSGPTHPRPRHFDTTIDTTIDTYIDTTIDTNIGTTIDTAPQRNIGAAF
jgi:hypothetical protein